jgi:hypothetical protein
MPAFLRGFNYISILKWGLGAVLSDSLRGVVFKCTPSELSADGTCPVSTGEDVLKLYNLDVNTALYALGMVVCVIVYRVLAYALLKLKLTRWQLKKV